MKKKNVVIRVFVFGLLAFMTWVVITGIFVQLDKNLLLTDNIGSFVIFCVFVPILCAIMVPTLVMKTVFSAPTRKKHKKDEMTNPKTESFTLPALEDKSLCIKADNIIDKLDNISNDKSVYIVESGAARLKPPKEIDENILFWFIKATRIVASAGQASTSMLQRQMKIGYSFAARLIDTMEECGIVGSFEGSKPRSILCTKEEIEQFIRALPEPKETATNHIEDFKQEEVGEQQKPFFDIDKMTGHEFEHFVASILKRLDYKNVQVTQGSGDQGVDVLAEKDGIRYAIQCKNYSHTLGNTPVQEVAAGKDFYNCHVGVVVTNNYFTQGGKDLADRVRVLLWDRDKLQEMIEKAK